MSDIFVSYRRSDSAAAVGRIIDHLEKTLGKKHIFRDLESIGYGQDFGEVIGQALKECRVVLVIIGTEWADIQGDDGVRRLEKPDDWVRIEVSKALQLGMHVIPVIVEDAIMPTVNQLPQDLRMLTRRNAAKVRNDPDFDSDIDRLISSIRDFLPPTANDSNKEQAVLDKLKEDGGWKKKIMYLMRAALVCAWIGSTAVSISLAFDFGFVRQWYNLHWISINTAYVMLAIGSVASGMLGFFSHWNRFLPGVLQGWVWPIVAAISQVIVLVGINSLANLLPFLNDYEALALFLLCGAIFPAALTVSANITRKSLILS